MATKMGTKTRKSSDSEMMLTRRNAVRDFGRTAADIAVAWGVAQQAVSHVFRKEIL